MQQIVVAGIWGWDGR